MNVSNNLNNLNKLSFGELKTFAQLNSAGNGNVNNANSKYNNAVNNTNATNTASSNTPKLQEQVKEDTVVLFGKEVKKKNLAIGASIIGGISIVATLISVLGRGKAIAGEDAKLVEKLKTLSYGQDDYLLENNEIIELIDYIEELIEKLNYLKNENSDLSDENDKLHEQIDEQIGEEGIKSLENFIWKLKLDNLYTPELESFINDYYMKYHND